MGLYGYTPSSFLRKDNDYIKRLVLDGDPSSFFFRFNHSCLGNKRENFFMF